jgi:hypothetical protein
VRRLQRRLAEEGDSALVHGLRGRPSNHRLDPKLRQHVRAVYRRCYPDFGPTLASEKLAEQGLEVAPETLRGWLLAEGLWQRQRQRDVHRRRRPRRSCRPLGARVALLRSPILPTVRRKVTAKVRTVHRRITRGEQDDPRKGKSRTFLCGPK